MPEQALVVAIPRTAEGAAEECLATDTLLRNLEFARSATCAAQADINTDRREIASDERDIARDQAAVRTYDRAIAQMLSHVRPGVRLGIFRPQVVLIRTHILTAACRREQSARHQPRVAAATTASTRASGNAKPRELTPTVMANNAAAENKKPPATQHVHQAWYHWFLW